MPEIQLTERQAQVLDWHKVRMQQLVGATITKAEPAVDVAEGFEVWPVLEVETVDGRKLVVEVSSDPEGNGPGHLELSAPDDA